MIAKNWYLFLRQIEATYFCFVLFLSFMLKIEIFSLKNTRTTRATSKSALFIPKFKTDVLKYDFFIRVVSVWNSLPINVTNCNNVQYKPRELARSSTISVIAPVFQGQSTVNRKPCSAPAVSFAAQSTAIGLPSDTTSLRLSCARSDTWLKPRVTQRGDTQLATVRRCLVHVYCQSIVKVSMHNYGSQMHYNLCNFMVCALISYLFSSHQSHKVKNDVYCEWTAFCRIPFNLPGQIQPNFFEP